MAFDGLGPEISMEEENNVINFIKSNYPHVKVNRVVLDEIRYQHNYEPIYAGNI